MNYAIPLGCCWLCRRNCLNNSVASQVPQEAELALIPCIGLKHPPSHREQTSVEFCSMSSEQYVLNRVTKGHKCTQTHTHTHIIGL